MKLTADEFNAKHPVGTAVTYYPVLPEVPGILPVITFTRTPAWELSHGAGVVSVDGRTGGVLLLHVELRDPPEISALANPRLPDLESMLDSMAADREESESIRCPYCDHIQNWESDVLGDVGLISYHGDEGPVDMECDSCEQEFQVSEDVSRTYETAKVGEDFE